MTALAIGLSIALVILLQGATLYVMVRVLKNHLTPLADALSQVAASKRLSTIFMFELKEGQVDPTQFEPKKEEVLRKMLKELRARFGEDGSDPSTNAFCVLSYSGFASFVSHNTREGAKSALMRLMANNDLAAAEQFVDTLVAQL